MTTREGRLLRQLTEVAGANRVVEVGTSSGSHNPRDDEKATRIENRIVSVIATAASILRLSLVLLLLFIACVSPGQEKEALSPADALLPMQQVVPTPATVPLVNPGMGLYLYGTLNVNDLPADAWFSSLVQIGYFREDWSVLEPLAQGKYRFEEYFGPIFDLWVNRWHRRVAFRFMSENVHSRRKYVTPKWVFDQGVPSVTLKGLYTKEQIDPVFWDDRYLAVQERFIADLGKYLDGRPGLEFIDIGSIGEWGEMHLARWTPEMLEQTGFSATRYIAAYRRLIDAFVETTPNTAGGHLAIEKGSLEGRISAAIRLDDVRLDMLESP